MKYIVLFCLLFCYLSPLAAQERAQLVMTVSDHSSSETVAIPLEAEAEFLSYFIRWQGTETEWQVRFSPDGNRWGAWQSLSRESHNPDLLITELQFVEATQRYLQLKTQTSNTQQAEIHFYDPGITRNRADEQVTSVDSGARACPCPYPEVEERSDWCPSGNCPKISNPAFTTVTHLIVHHSAGSNVSNDWAGVVRAIWNFHVNGNGWDDIGYNYLVDPDGVIYEGRGDNVRGAHFCGTNSGTMGVCVLGDFTNILPTSEAADGLVELLSWKSCDRDFSPLATAFHASSGQTLPRIAGHRDGCSTECPGDLFYPLMPDVRQATFARIVTGCSGLAGPLPLSATLVAPLEVQLDWVDNTEGESGFIIERKTIGGPDYTTVAQLIPDTETYLDVVEADQLYQYRIFAFTLTDTSAYSNEVDISTVMSSAGEEAAPWQFSVFPNPGQHQFQYQMQSPESGPIQLSIRNVQGQLLQQRSIDRAGRIHTGDWPAGLYYLTITQAGFQQQYKWVKQP